MLKPCYILLLLMSCLQVGLLANNEIPSTRFKINLDALELGKSLSYEVRNKALANNQIWKLETYTSVFEHQNESISFSDLISEKKFAVVSSGYTSSLLNLQLNYSDEPPEDHTNIVSLVIAGVVIGALVICYQMLSAIGESR